MTTGIVVGLGSYALNYFFLGRVYSAIDELNLSPDHFIFSYIERQQNLFYLYTSVFVFLVLTVVGILAVVGSHHLVGPIKKLDNELKKIAEGQKPYPIKFREGDFFTELEDSYNGMIQKIGSGKNSKTSQNEAKSSQFKDIMEDKKKVG